MEKEFRTADINLATVLLTYNKKLLSITHEDTIFFTFENDMELQNLITFFKKQNQFLVDSANKIKKQTKEKIRETQDPFADLYKYKGEMKRLNKGMPHKKNGVWS